MKREWKSPELSSLGAEFTKDTKDPGHGYDDHIHDHHCTCGLKFGTWAEAQAHELEMTLAGQSEYHNIGCNIFQS